MVDSETHTSMDLELGLATNNGKIAVLLGLSKPIEIGQTHSGWRRMFLLSDPLQQSNFLLRHGVVRLRLPVNRLVRLSILW